MIILGVDPGTVLIGYAFIDMERQTPRLLDANLLRVTSVAPESRLEELHQELKKLIHKWKPKAVAVERLFFTKNQKTAMRVAESRGAILLTSALAGLKVFEYTPLEIKKTIAGDGNADKAQLQKMLVLTLPSLGSLKARDDVFDAIAIGLTLCYKEKNMFVRHEGASLH